MSLNNYRICLLFLTCISFYKDHQREKLLVFLYPNARAWSIFFIRAYTPLHYKNIQSCCILSARKEQMREKERERKERLRELQTDIENESLIDFSIEVFLFLSRSFKYSNLVFYTKVDRCIIVAIFEDISKCKRRDQFIIELKLSYCTYYIYMCI